MTIQTRNTGVQPEGGAAATSASAELGLYVTAGKDRLELALRPAKEEANGRGNAAE